MEFHEPVLIEEIIKRFEPFESKTILDGTAGSGGHCLEFLKRLDNASFLIGLDRDPDVLKIARNRLVAQEFKAAWHLENALYENMAGVLKRHRKEGADCILLDLGINSLQLEDPERGFSFSKDGPLDGRFSKEETGTQTVEQLVNNASEEQLSRWIYNYSDERLARPIARRIVEERQKAPIKRTVELAELIRGVYPKKKQFDRIHPATRSFQALRIAANQELEHVEKGVAAALDSLNENGVLCVISFHSLEDKIVKRMFDEVGSPKPDPSNLYSATTTEGLEYTVESRGATKPSKEEIERNPRARSSRLRTIKRISKGGTTS